MVTISRKQMDTLHSGVKVILRNDDGLYMRRQNGKAFGDFLSLFYMNHYTPETGVVKNGTGFDFIYVKRKEVENRIQVLKEELEWFKPMMEKEIPGILFINSFYERGDWIMELIDSFSSKKKVKEAALAMIDEDSLLQVTQSKNKYHLCKIKKKCIGYVENILKEFQIEYEIF